MTLATSVFRHRQRLLTKVTVPAVQLHTQGTVQVAHLTVANAAAAAVTGVTGTGTL